MRLLRWKRCVNLQMDTTSIVVLYKKYKGKYYLYHTQLKRATSIIQ
jgi:hypothetical protein